MLVELDVPAGEDMGEIIDIGWFKFFQRFAWRFALLICGLDILDWQYHGGKSRFLEDLLDFIQNFDCLMRCACYIWCGQRALRDPDLELPKQWPCAIRWLVGTHWCEAFSVPALAQLLLALLLVGYLARNFWKPNARNPCIIALRPKEVLGNPVAWRFKNLWSFSAMRLSLLLLFCLGTHRNAVCWSGCQIIVAMSLLVPTLLCARN